MVLPPPVDAELEAAVVDALEADVETAIVAQPALSGSSMDHLVPSPGSTWGVIGIGTNRV